MKKMIAVAVATLGMLAGRNAFALNPVSVDVYAQITGTLSLTVVSATYYDFGAVTGGSTTVSTTTFDISHSGTGLTETFNISLANPAGWTAVTTGAPGLDQFELDAQLNFPGAPGAWTSANHAISTVSTAATASKFAGNQTGMTLAPGNVRNMWVRFLAPTSTTVVTKQRIVVTISATNP